MAGDIEVLVKGRVSRVLPNQALDSDKDEFVRLNRFQEQVAEVKVVTRHGLADEGTYFVTTTPTPGTAYLYPLTTAFSDTAPWLYIYNKDTATSGKRIYLDYIKLIVTVVPATTTQSYFAFKLDNVARALTTNNTTALTVVSPNMDMSPTSIATVNAQNSATASVVAAASASTRVAARGALGGLPVLGDELLILFGDAKAGSYGGTTTASRKVTSAPPLILGPTQSAVGHLWFPGNATTALSYELEMGWWER